MRAPLRDPVNDPVKTCKLLALIYDSEAKHQTGELPLPVNLRPDPAKTAEMFRRLADMFTRLGVESHCWHDVLVTEECAKCDEVVSKIKKP